MKGCAWIAGGLVVGAGLWLYKVAQETYGTYGIVKRVQCKSNLKSIAKASLLYAEDYDDRLLPASNWMDLLLAKDKNGVMYPLNEDSLKCPCGRTPETGPYGYAYNSDVAGKKKSEFELPEHTILFFESKSYGRNAADPLTSFSGPYDPAVPGSQRAHLVYLHGGVESAVKGE